MKFKSISTLALLAVYAFSAFAAPAKTAFYSGNYTGVFARAFSKLYTRSGDTTHLILNQSTDLTVFSQLGKYKGPLPEKEKMLAYLENGGIVVMFSAVPSVMFSKKRSLASAGDILGAEYYEYGKFIDKPTGIAEAILGDTAAGAAEFVAKQKSNYPAMGKVTKMVRLLGNKKGIVLGVNRVGKGALVYTSFAPGASPAYDAALIKLMEALNDQTVLDKYFPTPKKLTKTAFYLGDTGGAFRTIFSDSVKNGGSSGDLVVPDKPVDVLVFSHRMKYKGKKIDDAERAKIRKFVEDGGIVFFMGASQNVLYSDGKTLSSGADVLGASVYRYSRTKETPSELARKIFGEKTDIYNVYARTKGNHPGLDKATTMVRLFGGKNFIELGVNRVGKGAVVFTSFFPNDKEYSEALVKLLEILINAEEMEKYFPSPVNNQAITVNGKKFHLAIAQGGDAAAGAFFRNIMERVTGQKNFYSIPGNKDEYIIHIGATPYVKSLNLDLSKLHPYGYLIFCRDGKNLVITAKNHSAVMFAVNDFLKRFAGYRQFGAGSYFEIVPKRASLVLPDKLDIKEEPALNSYYLAKSPNSYFGRNNRLNCMATHALSSLVPVKKYYKTHPEYFPVINGKRKAMDPAKRSGPWNPCISNPDIPKLVAEYADEYFKKHPERIGLPLGVNDGGGDCQCEKCLYEFKTTGNQYARFYNTAAKVLAKKYPDKVAAFIAYSRCSYAVPKGVKMEPNVLVEATGMGVSAFREMKRWQAVGARHFGLYDYIYSIGSSFITPRYYPRLMGKLWKDAMKNYNLESMWVEYFPASLIFSAPRQYVLDNIVWNPAVDVEALLDDYFTSMYAEAGMKVKALFDLFETVCGRDPDFDIPIKNRKRFTQYRYYTAEDIKKFDAAMDAAVKAAKSDYAKRKINAVKKIYTLIRFNLINAVSAQELAKMTTIKSDKDVQKVLELIENGYSAIADLKAYEITPEEEADIFINPAKFGVKQFKNISTLNPVSYLERSVDPVLNRLTAYLKKNNRNISKFYRDAAAKTAHQAAKAALLTQVYMMEHTPVNLVRNPGFEDVKNVRDKHLVSDHNDFKGISYWHTWKFPNSKTEFFLLKKGVHSGKQAAAIGERQIGGSIISYVKLTPGCRYKWSFYVKRNRGEEGFGFGSAGIRLQGKGGWLDRGGSVSIPYPPECENKWVYVSTMFSAPDVPATALLIHGATRQGEGVYTAFDDVKLEKVYDPAAFETKKKNKVNFSGDRSALQTGVALKTANELLAKCEQFIPELDVTLKLKKTGDHGVFHVASAAPGKLTISGDDEGLRCGIYTLLNKLGIHWLSPAEEPILPAAPVKFDTKSFAGLHKPDFTYRSLHICAGKHHFDDRIARWMSFNRMNRKLTHLPEDDVVGYRLQELGLRPDTTVHAYDLLIPEEKYFKTKPEYFALLGGKRTHIGAQLCLSNMEMREVFANELLAQIKQRPHIGVYGFPPNDGYGHCECEKCLALDTPEDRKVGLVNRRVADFVKDICTRMNKKAPGVMLGHYSYSNFSDFMEYLPTPPENLLISVTQFHCHKHGIGDPACPVNKVNFARLKHIRSKVEHVYIYDYFSYKIGRMPGPFFRSVVEDFKLYKELKLDGWLSEASSVTSVTWESQWMNFYLAAKLLWSTDVSADGALKEICDIRYGSASGAMFRYWKTLEKAMMDMPGCMMKNPEEFAVLFTPAVQTSLAGILAEAEKLSPANPAVKADRTLFDYWNSNLKERGKYISPMKWKLAKYSPDAPVQPFHFVNSTSQLPDKANPTTVKVFDGGDHARFIITCMEKRMDALQISPGVYGGDCIELFMDDGKNPKKCYHYIFDPNGNIRVCECEGRRWNWSWQQNASVKATKKSDRWELDIKIPYADVNAKDGFGFSIIRNRHAAGSRGGTGIPAGGAYFKPERYIRAVR